MTNIQVHADDLREVEDYITCRGTIPAEDAVRDIERDGVQQWAYEAASMGSRSQTQWAILLLLWKDQQKP